MANRQRAEARRKAQTKARSGDGVANGKVWMWIALGVVIMLGGGILFAATRGDDSGSSSSDGTSVDGPTTTAWDTQTITVTGDPLPARDSAADVDAAVGMTAPTFSGTTYAGQALTVDATQGPYMLVFLAHWCPHCNAEVPRLNTWKHSGAVPSNLKVYGITTATDASQVNYPPGKWIGDKGWEWPALPDQSEGVRAAGKIATSFGADGWPYIVIVGADGKVKARASGEVEIKDLQAMVDAAVKA